MAKQPRRSSDPFERLSPPRRLLVPLPPTPAGSSHHIKQTGTVVAAGESITTHLAENEPAALAPLAGRIVGVTRATLVSGATVDAVEIETGIDLAASTPATSPPATEDAAPPQPLLIRSAEFTRWIDRLLAAGVAADRTSSPNFVAQLYQCLSRPIDTVLCCVLDSDPHTPLNAGVALAHGVELAAGIDLLAKLTGARRVWVVADPDSLSVSWFATLDPLIRADGLQLMPLRGDYPQSHPALLLHTLLGRRLRPGRLPVERGVLLIDAATAIAVGRVAREGAPLLEVPVVVRDHVTGCTHLRLVPMGTTVADLCAALDIPPHDARLRAGDFLRDALVTPGAVISAAGELVLHVTANETAANPDPCIRCAWCIEACPTRIHPAGLLEAAQRGDAAMAERYGIEACIECGICSYVCPSRLPLLAAIRTLS